jgi:hypothetical protein
MSLLYSIIPEVGEKQSRVVAVGQRICFDNVADYKERHFLLGEASSHHVICANATAGHQTFVGHGLKPEGMTEREIEQLMIDEFNKLPTSPKMISDQFATKIRVQKELELARIKLLEEPSEENKKKYVALGTPRVGQAEAKMVAEGLQKIAMSDAPLLSDIEEEFGFSEKNHLLDFRVDLIQHLVNAPLNKVSFDNIRKFTAHYISD